MVEIGPGLGAMTCLLLDRLGRLDVVEIDRNLIAPLEVSCGNRGKLIVHNENALRFDFNRLAPAQGKLRVVGNLPYNISTPLIFHLLTFAEFIQDMNFLLQKEVVQRISAAPATGDYGRLSVMVQYRCHAERLLDVDPNAFYPPPKVDSAVVRLVPFEEPAFSINNETHFARLVNMVFNKRRKTLKNALSGLLSEEQIAAEGIDPGVRGETLDIGQFAGLSNRVTA
jgi:16S rRNA (adenine1518-N6/adenine1519-N6)-dimethyltransferase